MMNTEMRFIKKLNILSLKLVIRRYFHTFLKNTQQKMSENEQLVPS